MAGELTWSWDIADGVYKQHALSKKLRTQAMREMVFLPYVAIEPGFGKGKGESITLVRMNSLSIPTDATLEETTKIPVDTLSYATSAITIKELGRAVGFTGFVEDLSVYDIENIVQKALKNQQKEVVDNAIATAMKTTYSVCTPTSSTGLTWSTTGTAGGTAAVSNLNLAHCGVIRDYLRTTMVVPPYKGNNYIGIASTQALRGIKNDTDFMSWRQYIRPEDVLIRSEVGTIENIVWVESNNTTALLEDRGTGDVFGEFVVFGDDFCTMVEIQAPELRASIPADFGRQKAVAWYAELAFGLAWPTTAAAGKGKGCFGYSTT